MLMIGLLMLIQISSFSQKLDLIVTTEGDSVACKIDSISNSIIYFKIKTYGSTKWRQTMYDTQKIVQFKYDCINSSDYYYKNGTSIIIGNVQPNNLYPKKFPNKLKLETASQDELNFYLRRAQKTKKTGTVLSIAGPVSFASGLLLAGSAWSGGTEGMWSAGLFLIFAGTGATVVGLPVLITGASRVKRINSLRNNASDSVFEMAPCNFQNYFTGAQQYGVKLSLKF